MPGEKETGLLRPAKAPNINAPIDVQIRQISDSIKNINSAIRGLQEKLNELEATKAETFKYLKGRLSKGRTAPNSDGEVEIKSSNNTVDAKANGNVLDLIVKNICNANLGGDWDVGSYSITAATLDADSIGGISTYFGYAIGNWANPGNVTVSTSNFTGSKGAIVSIYSSNGGNLNCTSFVYVLSTCYNSGSISLLGATGSGASQLGTAPTLVYVAGNTFRIDIVITGSIGGHGLTVRVMSF